MDIMDAPACGQIHWSETSPPKFFILHGALADDRFGIQRPVCHCGERRFLGRMESLGFRLRDEALLATLTQDVVKTSEIEGEHLNAAQVRSSAAGWLRGKADHHEMGQNRQVPTSHCLSGHSSTGGVRDIAVRGGGGGRGTHYNIAEGSSKGSTKTQFDISDC